METKEKFKKIFFEEVYRASAAKFFGAKKDSFHYKEFEKSFEIFWDKVKEDIKFSP